MAHRPHIAQMKIIVVIHQLQVNQLLFHLLITFKEMSLGLKRRLQFQLLPLLRLQLSIISQCMQFQPLVECSTRLFLEPLSLKKFLALQICSHQWVKMAKPSPNLDTSNKLLPQYHSNHHHRLPQPCHPNHKYRLHHTASPQCHSLRDLLCINQE